MLPSIKPDKPYLLSLKIFGFFTLNLISSLIFPLHNFYNVKELSNVGSKPKLGPFILISGIFVLSLIFGPIILPLIFPSRFG